MKNHKTVDGKLLQTNKKYSHLKLKQKEKIHQWMYQSYRDYYLKTGRYPEGKDCDIILELVLYKIYEADIWIPESEVYKHYRKVIGSLRKRLKRELFGKMMDGNVSESVESWTSPLLVYWPGYHTSWHPIRSVSLPYRLITPTIS